MEAHAKAEKGRRRRRREGDLVKGIMTATWPGRRAQPSAADAPSERRGQARAEWRRAGAHARMQARVRARAALRGGVGMQEKNQRGDGAECAGARIRMRCGGCCQCLVSEARRDDVLLQDDVLREVEHAARVARVRRARHLQSATSSQRHAGQGRHTHSRQGERRHGTGGQEAPAHASTAAAAPHNRAAVRRYLCHRKAARQPASTHARTWW